MTWLPGFLGFSISRFAFTKNDATRVLQRFTKGEQNGGPQSKIGTLDEARLASTSQIEMIPVAKLGKNHNFQLQRL